MLKGAILFQLWSGHPHRATRDLDPLGHGNPEPKTFAAVFREICDMQVQDDGLAFLAETVGAVPIKEEEEEYQGLRLKLEALLGNARIRLQIDIGFGDAVTPAPQEVIYPTLLDFPAPTLKAYPRETVVVEKYQAMVVLGIANSRTKDFYDSWNHHVGASAGCAIDTRFAPQQPHAIRHVPTTKTRVKGPPPCKATCEQS